MSKKMLFVFSLLFLVNYTTILAQKALKKTPYLTPIADAVGYVGYKINGLEVVSSKAINFLVVGDWGRNGQFKQQEVADRMGEAAEQLDAQFILSTGDNFYVNGVASVDDDAWNSSFENVYKAHSLMVDWHPVLGNHDIEAIRKPKLIIANAVAVGICLHVIIVWKELFRKIQMIKPYLFSLILHPLTLIYTIADTQKLPNKTLQDKNNGWIVF